MPITVQQLIINALRQIDAVAAGETPSPEELSDAFLALNQLISSWNAAALPVYQITRETFPLTGAQSYTIGPAQAFNTTRPVKIQAAAVVTANNISKPVEPVTSERWLSYLDKAASGNFAEILFYDHGFPLGIIYLAPRPIAGGTFELFSYKPIAQFATLADVVTFPDGYERALQGNLALDQAPGYGKTITNELLTYATDAKQAIFGLNEAILGRPSQVEPPLQQAA